MINRNTKENICVPLTSSFLMQVFSIYLIFWVDKDNSNIAKQIRGMWFHDKNEREQILFLLKVILKN